MLLLINNNQRSKKPPPFGSGPLLYSDLWVFRGSVTTRAPSLLSLCVLIQHGRQALEYRYLYIGCSKDSLCSSYV